MTPLFFLQGCGPTGGSTNEAPRILDVHTVVHTYGDHEAESNMTMTAYFQVEDENGIDDIDHARVTFPDGSWYQLSAHNRLFERNGEHYMRGHFFMPSTGDTEEKSFAMHGYKVEVVDKLSASKTQIFSIAEEGGISRRPIPESYTPMIIRQVCRMHTRRWKSPSFTMSLCLMMGFRSKSTSPTAEPVSCKSILPMLKGSGLLTISKWMHQN